MNKDRLNNFCKDNALSSQYRIFNAETAENSGFRKDNKNTNKLVKSLEEAICLSGLKDGMTISFHHHFRNGDYVVDMVLDILAEKGFKDLRITASSLTGGQKNLVEHIKKGVVTRIESSGIHGALGEFVSTGHMENPVIFRSHGGRAYALEERELEIDVAFIGAPSCDAFGNANGSISAGDSTFMCGSLGYAMMDAKYAKNTIIITNHLAAYPNIPCGISENDVDYVVVTEQPIGNPKGIMSGTTRSAFNPREDLLGEKCADIIEAVGCLKDGFSMQMGSGGASLAAAGYIRNKILEMKIQAGFALGGITGIIAQMHEQGLIQKLLDVQSFDLAAAKSLKENKNHQQISASWYASCKNRGAAVNKLDFVILSCLEADLNFNVNALTGSDGLIMGALGGHPDTAAGASVTVIVTPLTRGRIPCIVDNVITVVTPGSTVDIIVTDHGIAVNPRRKDLAEKLRLAGIPIKSIEELKYRAEKITGIPKNINFKEKTVGIVNYRDNTVIDVVRQV